MTKTKADPIPAPDVASDPTAVPAAEVVAANPEKTAAEQLLELQLKKELEKQAASEALAVVDVREVEVETPSGPVKRTETTFANGTVSKSY